MHCDDRSRPWPKATQSLQCLDLTPIEKRQFLDWASTVGRRHTPLTMIRYRSGTVLFTCVVTLLSLTEVSVPSASQRNAVADRAQLRLQTSKFNAMVQKTKRRKIPRHCSAHHVAGMRCFRFPFRFPSQLRDNGLQRVEVKRLHRPLQLSNKSSTIT